MSLASRIRSLVDRHRIVWFRTMFGIALVYQMPWEGDRIRVLRLRGTLQSATYLDDRWCEPPFPYLRQYDCMYDAGVPIRDVCMLGGGGYAYPKHVVAHHPHTRIDVVEIDPRITQIARKHFFLDRLCTSYQTDKTGRLGIICDDAVAYLESCVARERRYDAILNDCFAAGEPEWDMVTTRAANLVHECLSSHGLYLTNCITALEGDDAEPLRELVGFLGSAFAHVMAIPSSYSPHDVQDNVMVVATDGDANLPDAICLFDRL